MRNHRMLNIHDDKGNKQSIVLFDGECTLCSRLVQFLLRHNHSGSLSFASLQSETGTKTLLMAEMTLNRGDTVLLLQNNVLYSYSTAVLKIVAHLGFPWRLLGIFVIVPTGIRDLIYKYIAKNRYKWFGRKSFCIPDQKVYQERFLF
jgi:predicted DCC family thiol-disulfide oxidoreductase YuxK